MRTLLIWRHMIGAKKIQQLCAVRQSENTQRYITPVAILASCQMVSAWMCNSITWSSAWGESAGSSSSAYQIYGLEREAVQGESERSPTLFNSCPVCAFCYTQEILVAQYDMLTDVACFPRDRVSEAR